MCSLYDCNNISDDQILLTNYCKKNPKDIYIDYNFDFFLVINGALDHLDMKKDRIIITNKELIYQEKYKPCFIHGIGATNMNEIIKKLGYDNVNPLSKLDILSYDIKSIIHFKKYLQKYICILSFIIFISIIIILNCKYF